MASFRFSSFQLGRSRHVGLDFSTSDEIERRRFAEEKYFEITNSQRRISRSSQRKENERRTFIRFDRVSFSFATIILICCTATFVFVENSIFPKSSTPTISETTFTLRCSAPNFPSRETLNLPVNFVMRMKIRYRY